MAKKKKPEDDKVVALPGKKGQVLELGLQKSFSREREFCEKVHDLCYEYGEEIGVAGLVGCLNIVSMTVWSDQFLSQDEVE
jgi:hypothetical protein